VTKVALLENLMAYYLSKERNEDVVASYRRYQQYLRNNQDKFPAGAYALGTAEWWQLAHDHRCPHDSWLEHVTVSENADGERHEKRLTSIRVRLRAAYHDGHIELHYPRVISYQFQSPSCSRGLGDWLYDEFTLSKSGYVIHEIEWAGFSGELGSRWIIEASDIEFQWIPS
jgi:hypothetical protein